MRLIVPLQGVVQGRGGLFWGTLIPCALFYVLQLYIRQRRPPNSSSSSLSSSSSSQEPPSNEDPIHHQPQPRAPSKPPFFSSRASSIIKAESSPYYLGWAAYERDPFHPLHNPNGIIQLGLAENQLSHHLLQGWIASHPEASLAPLDQPDSFTNLVSYQDNYGIAAFRSAMAAFMTEVMGRRVAFDSNHVVLTSGATAALEMLAFCLGEPGNAFLVPSPYYPGFDKDMKWRSGIELVPVYTRSSEGFIVSRMALERAFNQTQRHGKVVRAVLVSSPNNPVGNTLDRDTLWLLLSFTREKNIHLICDEIYAGSVYEGTFTSVVEVMQTGEFDSSRVHVIYGLSKDLGIPGFRIGVLYTSNDKVLHAARRLARFCSVSSQTQQMLTSLLTDECFVREFLAENKRKLADTCSVVVNCLQQIGISCAKSNGGFYCWVDLRHLLSSSNEEGEIDLWEALLYEAKVNITPGSSCHCNEPGWFRLCFAGVSEQTLAVALHRVQEFVEAFKK